MLSTRNRPLLPHRKFYRRLGIHASIALCVIAGCLAIGVVGYHFLENMSWIDAFANAAMILSGMGPIGEVKTNAGKIFAGCYALFSGVAFLTTVAVLMTPVAHRVLHKFHIAAARDKGD